MGDKRTRNEHAADIAAIPDVERLCKRYNGLAGRQELADQAQRCLVKLRELQVAEKQDKALLQSSDNPDGQSELLRQAKSPEANPEELLRPGVDVDNLK